MRGGFREGAGRKPGSLNKRTLARLCLGEGILNDGKILPLEVMLKNMRKAFKDAERADCAIAPKLIEGITDPDAQFKVVLAAVQKALDIRRISQQYAVAVAAHFHPRMAAVSLDAVAHDDADDASRR